MEKPKTKTVTCIVVISKTKIVTYPPYQQITPKDKKQIDFLHICTKLLLPKPQDDRDRG